MLLPENVKYIIEKLYKNGFEAFAVGGCVRDSLMGKIPQDWDICTSAPPENVRRLFKRTVDTGIKHGTVTVLIGKDMYEVTTYRRDGEYRDGRRPETVDFVQDITVDLMRRDFTVNAMAYNDVCGLVDPFGGRKDIENKILRCVGEPDKRFNEDALRIMRGLRFSSTLMFEIERETAASIIKNRNLLKNIAKERISAELLKLITGDGCDEIFKTFGEVLEVFLGKINVENIVGRPQNMRIFALFDTKEPRTLMKSLKLSNKIIQSVTDVLLNNVPENLAEARFLCGKIGICSLKNLLLYNGKNTDFADEIEKKNLCCSIKDLNIDGKKIMDITNSSGTETGKILSELLEAVIYGKIENTEEKLTDYIIGRE